MEIIIPEEVAPSKSDIQEQNRQKIKEALKKKREKVNVSSENKEFMISDVKVLEFRSINLK